MSVRKAPDPRYPTKPWLAEVHRRGRRTRRRFRTRSEAQAFESSAREAKAPEHGIEEALSVYLKDYVPRMRQGRQQEVHGRGIREAIRGRTFDDVAEVMAQIRSDCAGKSVSTLCRRLSLLRRLGHLAEEWGWIVRAPKIRIPTEPQRTVWLTEKQVEALANRMPRCGDIVRLAAYTGLRRRELLELRESSVEGPTLLVRTLKQAQEESYRRVPVPKRVRAILKRIPFLATNQILRTEWEEARKAEKLLGARFHDLRHFYGSMLARLGYSDSVIMGLMGHTDPRMVQRYAHLRDEDLAKMVESL